MVSGITCIPKIFTTRATRANYVRRQEEARLASAVQETIGAYKVIQAFGLQQVSRQKFRAQLTAVHQRGVRAHLYNAYVEKTANLGLLFAQLLIVGLGALLVIRGALTAGELV